MAQITSLQLPFNEGARLASVLSYGILDTEKEAELEELTTLTAKVFEVPIVLITILDERRQWFKSNVGLSVTETERSISFCQYTIMGNDIMEVENAMNDDRFIDNPLVLSDPFIRFYCGAPLINEEGYKLGSLALIDRVPRKLTEKEKDILTLFSKLVTNHFELHVRKRELEKEKNLLEDRVRERTKEIENALARISEKDEKLVSLNNELSKFIYKITHDLLGPIKTMEGITDLVIREATEQRVIEYLQMLKSTELKLDHSLTGLIKYLTVRNSEGTSQIIWKNVLTNAMDQAKIRCPGRYAKLNPTINTQRVLICNQELLELLFEELFVNSIQFNQNEVPEINVRISDHDKNILLTISDNGIGILGEHTEKIFEMFFKTEQSKSSGLGLYIVKKITDRLRSSIVVESKKNEGCTFKIHIPLKGEED